MEIHTDFLVLGTGIAGLSFAIKAAELGTVAMVTKKNKTDSNTNLAQGGIAVVQDQTDRFEYHIKDTLTCGAGLSNEEVVRFVVTEGPERIRELVKWGVEFTRSEADPKRFDLGREGGHSMRRVVHAKDLTGRENTYLNGAILGMSRAEVNRKFDEIVDFSGVEKFIDTPVKRYSSGMYVRLAFAVAAHLEPEILIIDEVLAVGDAAFQKKCLGKIGDVTKEGRTVLFCSHSMYLVASFCERAIWLANGLVRASGPSRDGVARRPRGNLAEDRPGRGEV